MGGQIGVTRMRSLLIIFGVFVLAYARNVDPGQILNTIQDAHDEEVQEESIEAVETGDASLDDGAAGDFEPDDISPLLMQAFNDVSNLAEAQIDHPNQAEESDIEQIAIGMGLSPEEADRAEDELDDGVEQLLLHSRRSDSERPEQNDDVLNTTATIPNPPALDTVGTRIS